MLRMVALPIVLWAAVAMMAANGQSSSNEPDAFDIEPPLLKQNLSDEPLPGTPEAEVARLEKQWERAKKNAEGAERLWKIGVLAKVEVEQRLLKVIRCEADLATARLARAKEELVARESQAATDQTSKQELEAAKAAVAQLSEAWQIAAAKRTRAELDAAEANLRRQQKLLKLGSARKSDVDRAEERLAKLRSQKN
jgi:multidrug resistance efflux pump